MGRPYTARETAEHMIKSYRSLDKAAAAAADHKHSYDWGAPQQAFWDEVSSEIYKVGRATWLGRVSRRKRARGASHASTPDQH